MVMNTASSSLTIVRRTRWTQIAYLHVYILSSSRPISELVILVQSVCKEIFAIFWGQNYKKSAKPAEIHFKVVNGLYSYLKKTPDKGIYYWRRVPRDDLEEGPLPTSTHVNNYEPHTRTQTKSKDIRATVDSDYTGDSSHQRSVTGISIKIAGVCVYYKTRYQPTISLSSTEAEFIAACEAGKNSLYIRSILQ